VTDSLHITGSATAYRLYDVGYSVALDRAIELLGERTRGRPLPQRLEARGIQVRNPPLLAHLGSCDVSLPDFGLTRANVSVHLFDFGVCSLRLALQPPSAIPWNEYATFASAVNAAELVPLFDAQLTALEQRIGAAIERPRRSAVSEDYIVFRITRLEDPHGRAQSPDVLTDEQLVPLLLGERRPLSANARGELLQHRFSYYSDDLALVTWDNALVVEPREGDLDIEYVVEFANALLLELRVYDAELDAELPPLYDRIEAARRQRRPFTLQFRRVLSELQTRVADITEVTERAENAFKVLDDVYLARVYDAALQLFRATAWRRGIERKLQIFRDTYSMLNAESQATRAELLEIAIVALIVLEVILGLVR
jgi:hypothetical protein